MQNAAEAAQLLADAGNADNPGLAEPLEADFVRESVAATVPVGYVTPNHLTHTAPPCPMKSLQAKAWIISRPIPRRRSSAEDGCLTQVVPSRLAVQAQAAVLSMPCSR